MEITWTNPEQAAAWANGLVAMTNDYLRSEAITEAQRNIDYLNQRAANTTLMPVKQVIYGILENEINKEMLARGTKEYALKVSIPHSRRRNHPLSAFRSGSSSASPEGWACRCSSPSSA